MVIYLKLLIRPALIGVAGVFVWYFLKKWIGIDQRDQGVFEPVLNIIGVAHGLLAAAQISKVNDQNQKIQQAITLKNWQQFKEYECLRINPVIKLLLAVFSLIFFGIFVLYPFVNIYTGKVVVWATMFVLYLLWEVAYELDDPYHGIWKVTRQVVYDTFSNQMNDEEKIKYAP
ncbi:MAG: hypothetical protein KBB91_01800 [Candidatus Pacebacteria bacterium]|jgi:hypothetical protein|nr:hypothetical protein [Candidatus Paceibacterota bacterium]MBP9701254.1 hypothetical protein [Candidatus Paceibacterota bacterium]